MYEVGGAAFGLERRGKRKKNLPQAQRSSSEAILKP
jgi:hypothetical protein